MAKRASDVFSEIVRLSEQTVQQMESFDQFDPNVQEEVLSSYFAKGLKGTKPDGEVSIGFIRAAEMLVGLGGNRAATLLGEGLGHENEDIRMLAGDALTHLGEERLDNIMPAVEGVLERGGVGAEEMPFILAELDHPEVPKILARFLDMANPQVVAAALEALVDAGDEGSQAEIEALVNDTREVEVDDSLEGESTTTIGQLAKEALEMLAERDSD
jgi:HEAT repeat protein